MGGTTELPPAQAVVVVHLFDDEAALCIPQPNVYRVRLAGEGRIPVDTTISAARGYPRLPALDALNEIVTALLERLEPICLAA
jgi:hypothetical protein